MRKSEERKVTVLVDNDSWILPHAEDLVLKFKDLNIDAVLARSAEEIQSGWMCFFLGCVNIVKSEFLSRNQHNLVVHESDLPKGRGFAPMSWQILSGEREIPICLLEASDGEADAGNIWLKDKICLQGYELLSEWRNLQGQKTVDLCLEAVKSYNRIKPVRQIGDPSFYVKRKPKDSELDVDSTIRKQFNLLRVVDNERYPAFFFIDGRKYYLFIEKA